MADQKYCRNCGAPKRANATFCTNCGNTFASASKDVPYYPSSAVTRVSVPTMDRVIMAASGVNGQLELLPTKVRIKRKGIMSLATQGIKGDKEIMISQISSIQFKASGLTSGYIKFSFLGGQETKGGILTETHDENTVIFAGQRQQRAFEAIKNAVEQMRHQALVNAQPMKQAPQADIPGQIQKLAGLRDQGILTEQEFQLKKQELLSKM